MTCKCLTYFMLSLPMEKLRTSLEVKQKPDKWSEIFKSDSLSQHTRSHFTDCNHVTVKQSPHFNTFSILYLHLRTWHSVFVYTPSGSETCMQRPGNIYKNNLHLATEFSPFCILFIWFDVAHTVQVEWQRVSLTAGANFLVAVDASYIRQLLHVKDGIRNESWKLTLIL